MKEHLFPKEPLGDKDVIKLPGIGPVYAELFRKAGVHKVKMYPSDHTDE